MNIEDIKQFSVKDKNKFQQEIDSEEYLNNILQNRFVNIISALIQEYKHTIQQKIIQDVSAGLSHTINLDMPFDVVANITIHKTITNYGNVDYVALEHELLMTRELSSLITVPIIHFDIVFTIQQKEVNTAVLYNSMTNELILLLHSLIKNLTSFVQKDKSVNIEYYFINVLLLEILEYSNIIRWGQQALLDG